MKLLVCVLFLLVVVGNVQTHATPSIGISDYGRQVAEEFLSQHTSLFSVGWPMEDGIYRWPQLAPDLRDVDVGAPHVLFGNRGSSPAFDRDGNRIGDDVVFREFGLWARHFMLHDLNGNGIPDIFILWTLPHGYKEFSAVKWTMHVYDGGNFREADREFSFGMWWLDFFYYNEQMLMTQVDGWMGFVPSVHYDYVTFERGEMVTRPAARLWSYAAQTHHTSPEFRENPTRFDTGAPLVPIPPLDALRDEIIASVQTWLYDGGELFRAPDPGIRVRIDGEFVRIPDYDQSPVNINGRVLVPLRAVMEAMGFYVEWFPVGQTADMTRNGQVISVQIGNYTMLGGPSGQGAITLEVSPQLINGRVMVPLRAIAEAAGMTVTWDAENQIANITSLESPAIIDLITPDIFDVDVEVLSFIAGIYRITISPEHFTIDPRATPFIFWESYEGTFDDVHRYSEDHVSFIFRANPGTGGRNVRVIIGIEDNFGQVVRMAVVLKGNDMDFFNQPNP